MTSFFTVLIAASSLSFGIEYDAQPLQSHTAPFSVADVPLEASAETFGVSYVEHWESYAPIVVLPLEETVQTAK